MSNNIEWKPILRFPDYEVSKNHLVRHIRTKRIISQRVDPFDRDGRYTVTLVDPQGHSKFIFVQALVKSVFGEVKA